MAEVYKSGAFLQQCLAVHPLCVRLKKWDGEMLVLGCSSCKMVHRLTVAALVARESDAAPAPSGGRSATDLLNGCAQSHGADVSVRQVDSFRDLVVLRCAECRRHYDAAVASFETHRH